MNKPIRKNQTRQERVQVDVPLKELLRDNLQDVVVATGIRVMEQFLEEERTRICGARYQHDPQRRASRYGHAPGELVLGGRRVSVQRPRVRTGAGQEVPLPIWQHYAAEDPLQQRAVEQMVCGVATRQYERSLEPVPADIEARGTSKSAVSRRFTAAMETELHTWLNRDLSELDLVALMIDGIGFADHVILVALGIDAQGNKHVLGLQEGATENATACTALLASLRQRGVRTNRSILVTIDGAAALAKAVRDVFGHYALIQRCQVHKKRNIQEHLPKGMRAKVGVTLSAAYACGDADNAQKQLLHLADQLEMEHPGAAGSLREGLEETLTVLRLHLPKALERTLATTNPIENLMGSARRISRNVKRWRGGQMILRWMTASIREASKGFHRLKGHKELTQLVAALRQNDAQIAAAIDGEKKVG